MYEDDKVNKLLKQDQDNLFPIKEISDEYREVLEDKATKTLILLGVINNKNDFKKVKNLAKKLITPEAEDGSTSDVVTIPSNKTTTSSNGTNFVEEYKNPFEEIVIKPEYYGVELACLDFCIQILSGFIWECENTHHFIAFHPELSRIKTLLYKFEWLKKNQGDETGKGGQFWPQADEMLQLAFVEFALMIPLLWD